MAQQSLQLERTDIHKPATPTERPAWPADLPTQASVLAATLAQARDGLTLGELEDSFKGRGAWKKYCP